MDLESKATKLAFFAPKIFDAIHDDFPAPHEPGFTIERYRILLYIFNRGHCKLKDISIHMHLAGSTTSEIVGRMVQENFLVRNRNPYNRRQLVIDVSEKGIQVLQEYRHMIQHHFMEKLEILDEDSQNQMLSAYEQMYNFFLMMNQKREKNGDAVRAKIARQLMEG